jgi:NodT family efflux transporter outer membrane factor (OMF) lipoprotein
MLAILAFSIVWTGCASTVKTPAAPMQLPETFSKQTGTPLTEKWWHCFEDEILNDLVEKALRDNFSLQIAWDRLAQAEATARKAGVDLYPDLNLYGGLGENWRWQGSLVDDKHGIDYTSSYSLGLSTSYELDLWGRVRSSQQATALDIEVSKEEIDTAALTLSSQVANTWYRWNEQQMQTELLSSQIDTNEKVLELTTSRFRQGKITAADVLRQRQLVESTRGQWIKAKEQTQVLLYQLALLLGESAVGFIPPEPKELVQLPPLPGIPLPAELIQRRPDVRKAYRQVQSADQRVATAIADQFPRISLSAGIETYGAKISDLFDNWLANLAGNLVQPLFDGNLRKAEVERNQALTSQAIHTYGQTVLTSLQEVENALSREMYQEQYLENLQNQLATANSVLKRTRESYLKGQLDYLRVLESLVSVQSLERQVLTAQREKIEHRIDLCRAIAGGWTMDRPELASVQNTKNKL